tara:strand:- start:476 stop:1894 length:1419 start_codon:yes stop_codon:yes gene_type:complete
MKFKFILLGFFFLFFKAYANECKNFEEKVLSIPTPASGVVSDGQQPKYDTGIFLEKSFNYDKGELFLKRDKDNYPILRASFFEKDLTNDSIQLLNGKDLSKLNDSDIKDLLKSKKFEITQNKKIFKLEAKDYDLYTFDLNYFLLNSIENIDTKSGEFSIDYIFKISHERPDWIEAGREIGNLTICNIAELTENSKIFSPVTNETIFINHIKYDIDKNFSAFEQVYYKDTDKTFTDAIFSGLHIIKANFDFQRFPFDVQNLKIELEHAVNLESNEGGYYPKPYIGLFDIKPSVYNNIKNYKENNLLKEWKIVDFNIKNKIISEKAQDTFNPNKIKVYETDAVVIDIFIKRNINYFIFKILIPVFLILSIAWSVLWIPPNQVESRLTTSIVALLALIAYNFVFNDDLPKLSYLTSMDRYILLSYLFCCIPTFLTIYFSRINNKNYNRAIKINKRSRFYGSITYLFLVILSFSNI